MRPPAVAPPSRSLKRSAIGAGAMLALGLLAAAAEPPATPGVFAIVLATKPVHDFHPATPGVNTVGRLRFLGGLVVSSKDPRFGGLSGIRTSDRGRDLLMLTDYGYWVAATLASDDHGVPKDLTNGRMALMLDSRGRPMSGKTIADSEGLEVRKGPQGPEVLVSFEQNHRILVFAGEPTIESLSRARDQPLAGVPNDIRTLLPNLGLESIAVAPPGSPIAGALVAIGERNRQGETGDPGWIIGGPKPGRFHIVRSADFDASDATFMPNGDLLLLERRFSWTKWYEGISMRIRRIPAASLLPDAMIEGEEVANADFSNEIDNMEGIAYDTAPDGTPILTLISDDNQSPLQRTILLRFAIQPNEKPKPPTQSR